MAKPMEPRFLEIESPWTCQPGTLRVMQSEEAVSHEVMSGRARSNTLARPYIFDTPFERRMHFTQDATQSAMLLSDPDALISHYTRKMMAFLLFNPEPRHIVMIGLGGGSLPKFCHRHLPRSRITVVEINQDVIALRDEFRVPKDSERFRVIHEDGARYIAQLDSLIDVLLIDAFDAEGIAPSLANCGFYSSAAQRLAENGTLVMNFWGPPERYVENLLEARAAFGNSLLLVPVSGEANVLLFAFKSVPTQQITERLESLARRLQMQLTLDFPRYLRRICQGHTLSDTQTSTEEQIAAAFCMTEESL